MSEPQHRTPLEQMQPVKAYEQGYTDGGSSRSADWAAQLDEVLPSEVDAWSPQEVAAYIADLQRRQASWLAAGAPMHGDV